MASTACLQNISVSCNAVPCTTSVSKTAVGKLTSKKQLTWQNLRKQTQGKKGSGVTMAAHGSSGVEPDLQEDFVDYWRIPGEEMEEDGTFKYGKIDGAHSFHDGDEGTFLEQWNLAIEQAGGPTGPQKWISYLFLPNFFVMVAFGVEPEYYLVYTILFLFAFIGLEMAKPEKYTSLEPEVYRK